jgi:3-hydroxyacyl-CoA dehydrogenase/enoyl-CoA hydratase/3-hydroxybutyryl-CoA epimerase
VAPALIDNAAKLVGMPLGPLQLVDETSIDLGAKIAAPPRRRWAMPIPTTASDEVIFWMEDEGRSGPQGQGRVLRL